MPPRRSRSSGLVVYETNSEGVIYIALAASRDKVIKYIVEIMITNMPINSLLLNFFIGPLMDDSLPLAGNNTRPISD